MNDLLELQRTLMDRLEGDVRFDPYTRILYSTDSSNYQIEPLGVVFPRHEDDLYAVMEIAASLGVPVIPRGAGTGLAGQAIGRALIIDCSRYLNRIHKIDMIERLAEVEPGVVLASLNLAASEHGLMFGPDPASANRATMGGAIGSNASGAHSIRYGMVADHVLSTDVVLSDGSGSTFRPVNHQEAQSKASRESLQAGLYRAALKIRRDYAEAIRNNWPRAWRRSSGYNINYLVEYSPSSPPAWFRENGSYPPTAGINLAALLCGSEGTLAILRRATVRLVSIPKAACLVVLSFESIAEAAEATASIVETGPAAVELVPRVLIERAREVPAFSRKLHFFEGDPTALLVVEYVGDTLAETLALCKRLGRGKILDNQEAQADLWTVRSAGLGLLMSVPGDTKPITFIEDVAVPVERLGEYVLKVDEILAENGTTGEWYAHASAGCLHLRPLINLKTAKGVTQMRQIAESVVELVVEMGGAISGEHGDGLSHSEFNSRLFGPEIMQAFRQVKRAFDPDGLLNPGKIVALEGAKIAKMEEGLRFGSHYQATSIPAVFSYRREGDFVHAVETCTGIGTCRAESGVMCPSFKATREEIHSTRGRANLLRAALSGKLPAGSLTSPQMYQVLDLCLECKGCKGECPSAVDMARLKSEFLALYQAEHGLPLRSRVFANIAALFRLLQPAAILVNSVTKTALFRLALEKFMGISRFRRFPSLPQQTFKQWYVRHAPSQGGARVVLFLDTYTNHTRPETGIAAVKVLEAAGYRVEVAPEQVCCGRPMISKGLLQKAKTLAARNLAALAPYAEQGVRIIGLEPSCLLTLRDEYPEFFPQDPRTALVAGVSRLIEEFLIEPGPDGDRPLDRLRLKPLEGRFLLHGHCYIKSLVGMGATLEILNATGADVEEIDSGCCGMAGSFGYEVEHYDLSMQIGEMRLFPAIREGLKNGAQIIASGISCRTQIGDGTITHPFHPIEVLANALE